MKIKTTYIDFVREWQAIDEETYDAEYIEGSWSSSSPIGLGKTEEEAIKDLLEKFNE